MNRTLPTARLGLFLVLLAAVLSNCARLDPPTAPLATADLRAMLAAVAGSPPPGFGPNIGFFPLDLDNHWLFHERIVTAIHLDGEDPSLSEETRWVDHRLVCVEPRDGRDYVVDQVEDSGDNGTNLGWVRLRQDRDGLFEADVPLQEPPPCVAPPAPAGVSRRAPPAGISSPLAPAGPHPAVAWAAIERLRARLAIAEAAARGAAVSGTAGAAAGGELTRLRYPLRVGARWTVRNGPEIVLTASVEGTDVVETSAGRVRGFRIRLRSPAFDPADVVRVWYGALGYLQLESHLEVDVVDIDQVVGRAVVDARQTLVFVAVPPPAFTFEPMIGGHLAPDTTGGIR